MLAVTVAFPLSVKVQVLALLPLLEHAPDQMTSRPLVALNVIVVPAVNGADPLAPTATLIPAGLDVTFVPLRPVAVTVRVAVWPGGVRVRVAVRVWAPALAVTVTGVELVTELVLIAKAAAVAPAATATLVGTLATVELVVSVTTIPPDGAAAVREIVPCADVPPVTVVGLTDTDDSVAAIGGVTVSVVLPLVPP